MRAFLGEGRRARFGRSAARVAALLAAASAFTACNLLFGIETGDPRGPGSTGGTGGSTGSTSSTGGGGASSSSSSGTSSSSSASSSSGTPAPICDGSDPAGPDGTGVLTAVHAGGDQDAHGVGILFKSDGTTIVTGSFSDANTNFGVNPLNYPSVDGAYEGADIYVARYDGSSNLKVWAYSFGGPLDQHPAAMGIDPSRNIFIGGYFQGSLTFPPAAVMPADTSRDPMGVDSFLVKLDENGNPQWSVHMGGEDFDFVTSIALAGGDAVVTGLISGGTDPAGVLMHFGTGCQPVPMAQGTFGIFLSRYDDQGKCIWGSVFPMASYGYPPSVAVTPDGKIVLAGGVASSGFNSLGSQLSEFGGVDWFLAQFDSDGTPLWSFARGDANDQWASAVAVDPCGDIIVAGGFVGSVQLDASNLITAPGGPHGWMAKYHQAANPMGQPSYVWKVDMVDSGKQEITSVRINAFSDIMVAGSVTDDAQSIGVDFGDSKHLKGVAVPDGGTYESDAFVAKYRGNGFLRWAKRIGGAGVETARCVATDDIGQTAITGDFNGTHDFGLGPWTTTATDAYFLKLGP